MFSVFLFFSCLQLLVLKTDQCLIFIPIFACNIQGLCAQFGNNVCYNTDALQEYQHLQKAYQFNNQKLSSKSVLTKCKIQHLAIGKQLLNTIFQYYFDREVSTLYIISTNTKSVMLNFIILYHNISSHPETNVGTALTFVILSEIMMGWSWGRESMCGDRDNFMGIGWEFGATWSLCQIL